MNTSTEVNNEMKSYLSLAKAGHYPLFFNEWLNNDLQKSEPLSYRVATRNIRKTFKELSKHRSSERKKTALFGLNDKERKIFIRSFVKVVEHDVLKDITSLQ